MKRLIIAVCMLVTGIAISIGGYVNLKSILIIIDIYGRILMFRMEV